jgi:hypothetical protein
MNDRLLRVESAISVSGVERLLPVSSGLPRVVSMRFEIAVGREPLS